MSKLRNANKQIEAAVVGSYQKIEDTVVSGYKKIEDSFVSAFLAEDDETPEQAKARIMGFPKAKPEQNHSKERQGR